MGKILESTENKRDYSVTPDQVNVNMNFNNKNELIYSAYYKVSC